MRRKHDSAFACEAANQLADLMDLTGVEADGRFVEHQHGGIVNQRLRQSDALTITLRKLTANPVGHVGESADLEHVLDSAIDGHPADAAKFRDKAQVALDAHIAIERRGFRQVADAASGFERVGEDVEPVDFDSALARRHEAGNDAHGGGFAGAVRAEKAENLSTFRFE